MTDETPHPDPTDESNTADEVRGSRSDSAGTTTDSTTPRTDSTPATLVCSLEESAGKTAVSLALGTIARESGESVGYMKPKGTRLTSRVGKTLDADPILARDVLDLDAEMHDLEPVVYSPTFIEQAIRGRETPADIATRVTDAYETLADDADLMIVEGGGHLDLGGAVELTDPDVASLIDAGVIVVTSYEKPGDVDRVLAAADRFGDRFAGVVFNGVSDAAFDDLETDVVPFLEARSIPVHGVIPREQTLAGVTVGDLAEALGAEVLVDENLGEYVERFAVGAMGADSALRHFRRTNEAAVITGGDRSEIHTVALEASGVRCLILTGGHRPSGAVLGRATEAGRPILSVRTDTLTTVERAEDVVHSGRTRDERTVETMRRLLESHTDVAALLDR